MYMGNIYDWRWYWWGYLTHGIGFTHQHHFIGFTEKFTHDFPRRICVCVFETTQEKKRPSHIYFSECGMVWDLSFTFFRIFSHSFTFFHLFFSAWPHCTTLPSLHHKLITSACFWLDPHGSRGQVVEVPQNMDSLCELQPNKTNKHTEVPTNISHFTHCMSLFRPSNM